MPSYEVMKTAGSSPQAQWGELAQRVERRRGLAAICWFHRHSIHYWTAVMKGQAAAALHICHFTATWP